MPLALQDDPRPGLSAEEKSLAATASSNNARINVPLNLDNFKLLDDATREALVWFHQHALDEGLTWEDCSEALAYDRSTVFRILKGTYEGSLANVVKRIEGHKKLSESRGTITRQEFCENGITKLIFAGLDYALANNSITMIVGESRFGKTCAAKEWQRRNNHGRTVFVTAPPLGGAKGLVRAVAKAVGVNGSQDMCGMMLAVYRAFNKNRMLIVDEAHRCLPSDARTTNPAMLEFLRDLHDQTECGLALISTKRLPDRLEKGSYQFEQLIGRIGMPILIKPRISKRDVEPIAAQFLKCDEATMEQLVEIANKPGRLGIVVETLRVASRIASKSREKLNGTHVLKAIHIRREMGGGAQ